MKKLLVLTVLFGLMLSISGVFAISASISRSSTGAAYSVTSDVQSSSIPNSLHTNADLITNYPPSNEGRIRITFDTPMPLNNLEKISWMQYVTKGYLTHVDILLESGEVLVAEGAHQHGNLITGWPENTWIKTFNGVNCDMSTHWADGWIDCPSDLTSVNNWTNVWKDSGGTDGTGTDGPNLQSLEKYKKGWNNIIGTNLVTAIEIEVDGWVAESEAYIDDIKINDDLITNFDDSTQIIGEINENVEVQISPAVLNFGSLLPGTSGNPAINGPITINPTGSNVDVQVTVTNVAGFPFETGLKLDGNNPIGKIWNMDCVGTNICAYTSATTIPTLNIPAGASVGAKSGVITYFVAAQPH
ncbi:hypothetical protein J4402_01435 [Candidatus Pacearchaeota archaeon]|nr:hypothetical protein [Candidatus Pacearchaeota archaeon]